MQNYWLIKPSFVELYALFMHNYPVYLYHLVPAVEPSDFVAKSQYFLVILDVRMSGFVFPLGVTRRVEDPAGSGCHPQG